MKTNKIIIRTILVAVIVSFTFSACKKSYFDINQNPNEPGDAGVQYLLPSAQAAIAHAMGNNFQVFGGLWGQYWTQSPSSSQFKTIEQYSPASNDFDRPWKALYADALQDLKTITEKAEADNQPNYAAIAKILQAYTYQVLTDNFGDVPFSEALQGEAVLSPKYDSQESIYDGIIVLLKDGIAEIDDASDIIPGDDDLMFAGDMFLWREFGNTLLLKVYLRLSDINPTKAQAGIAALEADASEYLYAGENGQVSFFNLGGNSNPLYSSIVDVGFTQNLVASATAIDFLNNNADPRVDAFYTPSNLGTQVGIPQGEYTLPAGTPCSIPSPLTGGNGDDDASAGAPVKLITSYESQFLQAEAMARGWLSGDAQATYEAAITDNFEQLGFLDTQAVVYYSQAAIAFPSAGTQQDQIKAIITQKWIAMCGTQGDEAWIESRRTGYPDFFTVSVNTIIGAGKFPERFYYPSSEVTRNANFPGQKLVTDKVWWDAN